MKHTPGPWTFRAEGTNGFTDCGAIVGPDGNDICDFGDSETYYPSNGSAPSDEDARLICAAPELLALAEYVKAHPYAAKGMGTGPHAEWLEMQRLAEAAIAKAEGR